MPRSQCESENVQFVQELAEVDGPFESPININFRDLTKLELPSLVWNRGETCPKKMKITNTGHTVIISGKWKCERPYLTGGPLTGKYVFSQIHFHWGQDDCGGSEHLVCGDGFPLEMHVAHFKTEYLTQENALREKDGMVVVVYLFKLQDEPNPGLKKIIDLLPCLKQASTSHDIDPRPLLTLCKPFSDDYFLYWGSVVTSTCAHILLWIICREPFGISREQVMEFRKIMDSCQQPICKNSRDVQPLHKRNVFHVNASKHLDQPLLPIKNILGCYCKESGENTESQQSHTCLCQKPMDIQEDVEGITVDGSTGSFWWHDGGTKALDVKMNLQNDCFAKQTIYVQRATVSVLLKKFDSEPDGVKAYHVQNKDQETVNIGAKSCCFFTLHHIGNRKVQKKKAPLVKKSFKNAAAFSQIMNSLEFLKNQTSKKLKDIESINQEIKGGKVFCQPTEDSRWLGKIEKVMKQKRFNFKYSDSSGCFGELRKIAKDCNHKFLPEKNYLSVGDNNTNGVLVYNDEDAKENLPQKKKLLEEEEDLSEVLNHKKDQEVTEKSHKLIENFFEDIQESEEEKSDVQVEKVDQPDDFDMTRGYITENMFLSGNLEGRFFQEVTADDFEITERVVVSPEFTQVKIISKYFDEKLNATEKLEFQQQPSEVQVIPIHKGNYIHFKSKASSATNVSVNEMRNNSVAYRGMENNENSKILCGMESSDINATSKLNLSSNDLHPNETETVVAKNCKTLKTLQTKGDLPEVSSSTSNLSTESDETHRMIIAKFSKRPHVKDSWEPNSLAVEKNSYLPTAVKKSCKEIEGYYIHRKNLKHKKRKKQRITNAEELNELQRQKSTSSKEDLKTVIKKLKWKDLRKAKFRLEIEKVSISSSDLELKNSTNNSKRKKLRMKKYTGLSQSSRDKMQEDVEVPQVIHLPTEREDSESNLDWPHPGDGISPNEELKASPATLNVSSSVDSKLNFLKNSKSNGQSDAFPLQNEIEQIFKRVETKPIVRNRSLGSLLKEFGIPEKISHRHQLEFLSSRVKNNTEISRNVEKFSKNFSINQTFMSGDEQKQPHHEEQTNLKFLTSNQMDEELLPKSQLENIKEKMKTLKRCDMDKYQFLEENFTRTPTFDELVEEYPDIVNQTDSNKSFIKNCSKGDAELEKLNYQTSLSFLTLKMSSPSRPHSEETLSSTKQTFKSRSKKRPHCCKRNSRHYIRKNSSVFKKLNKTDSKLFSEINSTKEGQFHIISLNIQKYFQQILDNQGANIDTSKSCSLTILNISSTDKLELTKPKPSKKIKPEEAGAVKDKGLQKIRMVKTKEKQTQKLVKTKSVKSPSESAKPEKRVSALPNLIKKTDDQNKNRLTEIRTNEKLRVENQNKKFKSKIPKKRVENREKIEKPEGKLSHLQKKTNFTVRECQINKEKITTEKNKMTPKSSFHGKLCKTKSKQSLQEGQKPRGTTSRGSPNHSVLPPTVDNQKGKSRNGPIKNSQKKCSKKKLLTPTSVTTGQPVKNEKICSQQIQKPPSQVANPPADLPSSQNPPPQIFNKRGTCETFTEETINLLEKKISHPFKSISSSFTVINTIENQTGKLDSTIADCEEKLTTKALQRNLSERKFNFPINLLTPYMTSSMDLLNRSQSSRYLLDPLNGRYDCHSVEDRLNPLSAVPESGGALFSKELEYFLKLRMLFNRKLSGKMENCYATSMSDLLCLDSCNKKTVVVETTELGCLSSRSKSVEESGDKIVKPQPSCMNITKESGDYGSINLVKQDRTDGSTSDSSYEYKISITLNAINPRECLQNESPVVTVPKLDYIVQETSLPLEKEDNILQQEESVTPGKTPRRKRNDNEMSIEMKQKLIEIFEEEINKGIGVVGSFENFSDGNPKLEDSDKTYSQSSVVTSYDNLEILQQISDTMKEYLIDLKENGQLEKMLNKSLDFHKS